MERHTHALVHWNDNEEINEEGPPEIEVVSEEVHLSRDRALPDQERERRLGKFFGTQPPDIQ